MREKVRVYKNGKVYITYFECDFGLARLMVSKLIRYVFVRLSESKTCNLLHRHIINTLITTLINVAF